MRVGLKVGLFAFENEQHLAYGEQLFEKLSLQKVKTSE